MKFLFAVKKNFLCISTRECHIPIVGQQPIAEDEPASLVALDVVGPLEEPTLVCISLGGCGGLGL